MALLNPQMSSSAARAAQSQSSHRRPPGSRGAQAWLAQTQAKAPPTAGYGSWTPQNTPKSNPARTPRPESPATPFNDVVAQGISGGPAVGQAAIASVAPPPAAAAPAPVAAPTFEQDFATVTAPASAPTPDPVAPAAAPAPTFAEDFAAVTAPAPVRGTGGGMVTYSDPAPVRGTNSVMIKHTGDPAPMSNLDPAAVAKNAELMAQGNWDWTPRRGETKTQQLARYGQWQKAKGMWDPQPVVRTPNFDPAAVAANAAGVAAGNFDWTPRPGETSSQRMKRYGDWQKAKGMW